MGVVGRWYVSHRAVNWALEQCRLKPGPWVVLIKLADRHNKDTLRVDPEQAKLASDCNMVRSTVNRHLDTLEGMGLLVRVPRVNPQTNKQLSTFYVLELDFARPPHIENAVSDYGTRINEVQNGNIAPTRVAESDTEAVSEKTPIPCPKNSDSRVSKSDTNHGIEPVREPCAAYAPLTDEFFHKFIQAFPRTGDLNKTCDALNSAIEAGASPDEILSGARAYAAEQKGNASKYIAYPANWLGKKRWLEHAQKPDAGNTEQIAAHQARAIRSGRRYLTTQITPARARELVAMGVVTAAECAACGVAT